MNVTIRKEQVDDYADVYQLIKEAFATAEHSDGDEQDLVDRLRKSKAYIPELALIAESRGRLVGYIMFSHISIGETVALAVGPLAVLPAFQGKGVGGALLLTGHEIAKNLGYPVCVLLGHAGYYPRFGYQPASFYGIQAPFKVPDENYMAFPLQKKQFHLEGIVQYPEPWGLE